jgi:hypothetical protein
VIGWWCCELKSQWKPREKGEKGEKGLLEATRGSRRGPGQDAAGDAEVIVAMPASSGTGETQLWF